MKGHLQDVGDLCAHIIFFNFNWIISWGKMYMIIENFGGAYVGCDDQTEKSNACGLKSLP